MVASQVRSLMPADSSASAAVDLDVVAGAAVQHVRARPAEQHVVTRAAGIVSLPAPPMQHVVTGPAVNVSNAEPAATPEASITSSPAGR